LGEDADVGPLRVPARTAVPRSRGNVLGPVGEEDDLDVGELLESAQGFAWYVLSEFHRADDLVPVVIERLSALVSDVRDRSNGVVHATNLPIHKSAFGVDISFSVHIAKGIVGRSSR
jgi:hypothetical protein